MIYIKDKIYQARAEVAGALAHATRLKIVDLLAEEGEYCVCELTEILEVSQSTVSKHLRILRENGLVESQKEGLKVYYKLKVPCINEFFSCLDRILKQEMEKRREELGLS